MNNLVDNRVREYKSGDVVEPGIYIDMNTGAIVQVQQQDELPHEIRIVQQSRKFRRLDSWPPGARF